MLQFEANALPPPPANDDIENATAITAVYQDEGSTIVASTDLNDPNPGCALTVGETIWYTYTPTNDATLVLDTAGSDFDTVISTWTIDEIPDVNNSSETVEIFNQQACSNDIGISNNAYLEFEPVTGTQYFIMLGGENGASGEFALNIDQLSPPANNTRSNAQTIILPTANGDRFTTITTLTQGATTNTDESLSCNNTAGRTVWYRYTAGSNPETLEISTNNSSYNTVLGLFDDNGNPIDCADNTGNNSINETMPNVDVDANQTIYIMVGGAFGETGFLQLSLESSIPPSNDNIENAITIANTPYNNNQSIEGATTIATDPRACDASTPRSVWYQYTATGNNRLNLSTIDSDYQTLLAIYTLDEFDVLQEIDCGTGQNISLTTVTGTQYFILISDPLGTGQSLNLSVTEETSLPNDNFEDAQAMNLQTTYSINTITATDPVTDPITCQESSGKSVWYSYTSNTADTIAITTIGQPATIAVYTGTYNNLTFIACISQLDSNTTTLDVTIEASETYFIMLSDPTGQGGDYAISIVSISPPEDDTDSDWDGIPDDRDACPTDGDEEGLGVDDTGCPFYDTDWDGFYDRDDACPWAGDVAGLGVDDTGCPFYDTDWDDVYDRDDACPTDGDEEGLGVDDTGCTLYDSDWDGFYDRDDACPWAGDVAGLGVDDTGCPFYDADWDGIYDRNDACPWLGNEYGLGVDDTGCPINPETFATEEVEPVMTEEITDPIPPTESPETTQEATQEPIPTLTEEADHQDTDGDDLPDAQDTCPWLGNEGGLGVDDTGCPFYDADWDGIYDRDDTCPWQADEYGLGVDDTGCPIETADGSIIPEATGSMLGDG